MFRFSLLVSLLALFVGCGEELSKPPVIIDTPIELVPLEEVPALADRVIYEANMLAFSSHGTLSGVTDRLDQIQELGVNVIWLMPIYPIGTERSIHSPYCVKDYRKVNGEMGSLNDLKLLINEAHERDMAVILDWVANHTAWDHPWISAHPEWYTQDTDGNIIAPPGTGWTDVAELNFSNFDMRAEMIASMKYWITEAGVDGFRCDAVDFVPSSFWKTTLEELRTTKSDVILLAEGGMKDNFTSGFEINYSWDFYTALKAVYEGSSAGNLVSTNTSEYTQVSNNGQKLRYITNHDVGAFEASPVDLYGLQGSVSAFVASSFISGVPLIYTGQEVGNPSLISFLGQNAIDWTQNPSIFESYKTVMEMRAAHPAARSGDLTSYFNRDVLAFSRKTTGDEVFVMINTRNRVVDYSIPSELVGTDWEDINESPVKLGENLQLDANSFVILARN